MCDRYIRISFGMLFASLLVLLTGCQVGVESLDQAAPGIRVEITAATCPSLDVKTGDQVTWTNQDREVHIVEASYADGLMMFKSGELQTGDSFSFVFTEAGQYEYVCSSDGALNGIVTVEP